MLGRIYKIIDRQSDICYIGSTCSDLKLRWSRHKDGYRRWLEGDKKYNVSIYQYLEEYGIDRFKMILIKEYEVEDKTHLTAYEQLWINKFRKTCINNNNPFRFQRLHKKDYNKKNKEAIDKRKKEKFACECGGKYTRSDRAKHFKTRKHEEWLVR